MADKKPSEITFELKLDTETFIEDLKAIQKLAKKATKALREYEEAVNNSSHPNVKGITINTGISLNAEDFSAELVEKIQKTIYAENSLSGKRIGL